MHAIDKLTDAIPTSFGVMPVATDGSGTAAADLKILQLHFRQDSTYAHAFYLTTVAVIPVLGYNPMVEPTLESWP